MELGLVRASGPFARADREGAERRKAEGKTTAKAPSPPLFCTANSKRALGHAPNAYPPYKKSCHVCVACVLFARHLFWTRSRRARVNKRPLKVRFRACPTPITLKIHPESVFFLHSQVERGEKHVLHLSICS